MKTRPQLIIGDEDYKEIIDHPYYYIDKTLFIQDLIDNRGKVTLFTRPRRFGKTLTLSMIQTFFERELDQNGQAIDNRRYFADKKIMKAGETYAAHMGRYPVISLSLKSAKQPDFQKAYKCLLEQIALEYERHRYVLQSDLILESNKKRYRAIMERQGDYSDHATSLAFLSRCLRQYHQEKTIILLDEYDVPLENAWFQGFYQEMTNFIRSLFESALKTNPSLEFAVITGCLRISRESIFTGLNNLKINSILDEGYSEYFGFTEKEVQAMLREYGLQDKFEEVQDWYDGYQFGRSRIYNPWSVLNYVDQAAASPKAYWSNTSSNDIVRKLIERADSQTRTEIERLIEGDTILKPIHEEITYEDIYDSHDNLWNFLFFTGYLKAVDQHFENDTLFLALAIPNREIAGIYRKTIRKWFQKKVSCADLTSLYQAILTGDCQTFEAAVRQHLRDSISFWDSRESFYHGFMLGLLSPIQGYQVASNLESGEGRSDLTLIPDDERQPAVIMEFKHCKKFSEMEKKSLEALRQIRERHYTAELEEEGYENIMRYGIGFCKKSCRVSLEGGK